MVDIASPVGEELELARFLGNRLERSGLRVEFQKIEPGRNLLTVLPAGTFCSAVTSTLPILPARRWWSTAATRHFDRRRVMAYEGQIAETVLLRGHQNDQIDGYLSRPLGAGPFRAAGGMPDDRTMGDVQGAVDYLRALPYLNGKIGVIGYCSGGRQSYLAACTVRGLDAAVDSHVREHGPRVLRGRPPQLPSARGARRVAESVRLVR